VKIRMNVDGSAIIRFGPFELKLATGELWKSGTKIRLQGQALRILIRLLEAPGQFKSREELRRELWPEGTFVDFDHSLNVAVNRLRERLGDTAENSRYIQTVSGLGYRFVGPVERGISAGSRPLGNEAKAPGEPMLVRKRRAAWI
jgi:DNA-binding winged helix-turn-helix (wHTH) protein